MALLQISEPGQSTAPHQHRLAAGIDLGTTNSLVATVRSGQAETLADDQDRHLLPSIVHYAEDKIMTGFDAGALQVSDPLNTLSSIKRLMGRGASDVMALGKILPYELVKEESSTVVKISTRQSAVTAVEVSAEILKTLAKRATDSLGDELSGVVITVPAYFDDAQRQATRDAAKLAQLNVFRLLNEPTAAAVAYGLDQNKEGVIAVYDLGGGTFDISILRLNKGVFEVLATGGDSALGGDDMDHVIAEWIMQQAQISDADLDVVLTTKILQAARQAKENLTRQTSSDIKIQHESINWSGKLDRQACDELLLPIVKKTLMPCRRVLRDADISKAEITTVVMVGGSTRVPLINQLVGEFFESEPMCDLDPDRVVAIGAAIQANVLAGNKPDQEMLLLDVLPLSLGIETMGGLSEKVINRNTPIPVSRAQEFTTFKDGQTAMSIHVVQGERELISDCRSLAHFELRGIPPMVAGAARIKVTFQVDADGLMTVKAEEKTSGIEANIVVKPSYGLTDTEIETMLRDSMSHAKEDILARMLAEQQLEAKRVIEALDSALAKDGATLLSDTERAEILTARYELASKLETLDAEQIKKMIKNIETVSQHYVAKRMDASVKQVLAGQNITDVNV